MYPLLVLSLLSVSITVERTAYWLKAHNRGTRRVVMQLSSRIRAGDLAKALSTAESSKGLYAEFVGSVIRRAIDERGSTEAVPESAGFEMIEAVRPSIERFSTLLATIIAAAPLLGILGTVTGIIDSFKLLGGAETVTDPTLVAAGIAEALYTTAFGLSVALVTLFPHAAFKSQSERCLSRLETLAAALAEPPTTAAAA